MPTCQTRGLCLAVLFFQVVGVCRAALGSGHFTADFVAAYAPLVSLEKVVVPADVHNRTSFNASTVCTQLQVYLHPEETFLPSSIDFGLEFEQVGST